MTALFGFVLCLLVSAFNAALWSTDGGPVFVAGFVITSGMGALCGALVIKE